MEHMLQKMARQLNAMDEASLMALWDKYLQRVQNFDGSQEWEEAAIMLSLIQAPKLKNQLFNSRWLESHSIHQEQDARSITEFHTPRMATVHPFRPRKKA